MKRATKVLAGLAITGIATLTTIGTAGAFPVGEVPHVSCDTIEIDPPTWLQVHFTGTIGGVAFDRTAVYNDTPGIYARVNISDLTTGTGPLAWTVHADGGYLGTADSEGTIECHQPPTTTSSPTTTPPTTPSSTTTSVRPSPTSTCEEPRGCCLQNCEPTNNLAGKKKLPFTGSSSLPFGAGGFSLVTVGAALMAFARRRAS